ncbi:MAG: VOC family protein [Burkholderiaceae bacterium]|jgi:2,3-dihydroxybiphenyl 1,2-dioxygenase|nr:VOC family protein [Burkholderiaceae bacterium]
MKNPIDIAAEPSLFGRISLGHVVVQSRKLSDWQRFAHDGLGLQVNAVPGGLALRIDQHERRIVVEEGPAEDVVAIGWQLHDEHALPLLLKRLRVAAIDVREGRGDEAAARGVERLWVFDGPKRLRFELFTRPLLAAAPTLRSSGFVTGALGLGHFAMTTREPEAALRFFQQVFDARLSDTIEDKLNGVTLELSFLRLNERHHSVALAATRGQRMNPLRTGIHHLNLQAASLDDVTEAYQRMRKLGFAISNSIGQHPNDREVSFYVASPSGFDVELGWNPIVVSDEAAWQPAHYQGISLWGHFPESLTLGSKLGQMGRGIASLARKEYTVGAAV